MNRVLLFAIGVLSAFILKGQVNSDFGSEMEEEKFRQFDFWIGEWDVNLRMQQEDNSWIDAVRSTARIYRILDGRAILELWNENKVGTGIKGYSLRYYNPKKEKWELWLNWPGNNQAGSSSLEGSFRHGRGDFYSEHTLGDSTRMISRYSFNDITSTSLRWDDAYSKDNGKTWSNNWIMEFSRTKDLSPPFSHDENLLTYDSGNRCQNSEFRSFENLTGEWKGNLQIIDENRDVPVSLKAFKALDGCAVFSFIEILDKGEITKNFSHLTYNTFARKYEESVLTNDPEKPIHIYYGNKTDGVISGLLFDTNSKSPLNEKSEWSFDEKGITWRYFVKKGEGWEQTREAIFEKS